ncbi:MAG: ABC transporter ATP-binding protein/permease [Lachnospiraceae bacterium]|nr:ABC transporter ATP-binding protein/permease [Lachnospiraceae bacterium]
MLKKIYGLSDKGQKALYKASVWLTLFELFAALPMLLVVLAVYEMLNAFTGTGVYPGILKYIILGVLLLAAMYLTYRKMYKVKYLEAGEANLNLRMDVANRLRLLPEEYLSRHDLSDLTSTIMDDMTTIEGALINQVAETISAMFSGVIILGILMFVNVKLTLCLAVCLPIAILSMALSKAVSGKTHLSNRKKKLKISEGVQEYLENIQILKASDNLDSYQNKVKKRIMNLLPGLVLFEFLAGGCVSAAYNVMRIGIAIVTFIGANMLVSGEITPVVFLTFLIMSVWVYEPLSHANESLGALIASWVAADRIREIREYPLQKGDKDVQCSNYDIEFKNVSFSYDKGKETLHDISFTANQGKYTALVGASGSGKSTVCRLCARFRDIDGGSIKIGGQDISEVDTEKLFGLFSIVFQDVTLFNDTIYNNILIGNKNATKEELMRAAEYAECMSFIDKLPNGFDTMLGENGHTLSGGERQRLSIARAFLKDAPIILLDESTASLDPETETKIQAAIEKLTKGKTVLMIAHRLRSIVNCDKIVVLDKGRVVGDGKHNELMSNCPEYKKIYELQSSTEEMKMLDA